MNRKIPLDTSVYCPYTGESNGGDEKCDHDYDPQPIKEESEWAEWKCTKCGMVRTYEVWQ